MTLKLIHEPTVYLVSDSRLSFPELGRFLTDHDVDDWTSDADHCGDLLPEVAGRLCYMSFKNPRPGGNKAYLDHIKQVGHGSVLEHSTWGLIFTGVSRSLTHELVRHRAGMAYSQLSQRYVDESDCAFVVPSRLSKHVRYALANPSGVGGVGAGEVWLDSCASSLGAYQDLVEEIAEELASVCASCGGPACLESLPRTCAGCGGKAYHGTELRKKARETARSVLPNCTETKIMVTGNARAWRHWLEMRCSRHADVEIRRLAGKVYEVLIQESPNLFGDYSKVPLAAEGDFELTTPTRKV